ncbi:methyltransferase domain-containing protein [Streptomyces brevispora]
MAAALTPAPKPSSPSTASRDQIGRTRLSPGPWGGARSTAGTCRLSQREQINMGCGPGTDLPAPAERVGDSGTVIGVDRDQAMLTRARERTDGLHQVEIGEGDVHDLPVEPGTVDRAKIDRVLMHVAEPADALAQLHRVTRPGARIGLCSARRATLRPIVALRTAFSVV